MNRRQLLALGAAAPVLTVAPGLLAAERPLTDRIYEAVVRSREELGVCAIYRDFTVTTKMGRMWRGGPGGGNVPCEVVIVCAISARRGLIESSYCRYLDPEVPEIFEKASIDLIVGDTSKEELLPLTRERLSATQYSVSVGVVPRIDYIAHGCDRIVFRQ